MFDPLFFVQVVIGGLLQGAVFAMVAIGFSLVYRVTGVVNLSQGAFCVLGALTMYELEVVYHWPVALALLGAVAGTSALVVLIGRFTFVPAVARLPSSGTLMLTAGLLIFFEGLVLVVWGSQAYALPPFSGEQPVAIGSLRIPSQGLWLAGTCSAMALALLVLLQRTRFGRALRACADNPAAARLMGIDVERMMLASLGLAAGIGACSGVLIAPITSIQFDTGAFFTNFGFIAVAIGGMGSFAGAIVGGLVLGVVAQLSAAYVSSLFSTSMALLVLLAVIMTRPSGLFATGPLRRADVREEPRAHRGIVRLEGRRGALVLGGLLAGLLALPLLPLPGGMLDSLVIALIFFIAVLGLDVQMGLTGQVNLGQAGFMAIGGYVAAVLATTAEWPTLLSIGVAVLAAVACAAVLFLATARLRGHYLALATLAFGLLVDSLTVGLSDVTGGPSGLVGIPSLAVGGLTFDTTTGMYHLVLAIAAVLVLLLNGALRSDAGRAMQAVRADQVAAAALGIRVERVKLAAFAISAALGALAGALYAFDFHFLSPDMVATPHSFELIAMLVLGGEGTLVGGLFGAVILTLLPTLAQGLSVYKTAFEGALLIAVFRFLPEGLFGWSVTALGRRRRPAPVSPTDAERVAA